MTKTTTIPRTRFGGFYVYFGERFTFQSFPHIVGAKRFLDMLIQGDEVRWGTFPNDVTGPIAGMKPEPMLITASGVKVRGAGLEEAMEYEYQGDEASYVFPEPYQRQYESFVARGPIDTEPKQIARPEPVYDHETGKLVRPTKERKPKAPKVEKPARPSKEGLVTVQDIAKKNGWDAKHARAALRKAKVEKPAVGWAFPTADVAKITKLIKENLK